MYSVQCIYLIIREIVCTSGGWVAGALQKPPLYQHIQCTCTCICTSVVHLEKFPRGGESGQKKVLGGQSHKCENGSEVSRGGEIHRRGGECPPLNEALYIPVY